jgi:glycosyltransferase involved in cell wall biosynthesis
VSHLFPNQAFPGLGPFVRDEVNELSRRNRIAVISPMRWLPPLPVAANRRERRVAATSIEDGIKVLRPRVPAIPFGGLALESRLWAKLLHSLIDRLRREIDADLVHAHFAIPDGFAASHYSSRTNIPLVVTVRGSDVMEFGRNTSLRLLLRRTFAAARAIIAVSDELANRVEALGVEAERICVVPGGVPYAAATPRQVSRDAHRIPSEAHCILWVGNLVRVKQPLHMIDALEHLLASGRRDALLVMIGDGPLHDAVRKKIRDRKLDHAVRLIGRCPREEVWAWQCAADLVVNSSRSEGTPLSVLEAVGAGTPVVAYDVGGIRAVVEAVRGGTIAVGATPADLADAILRELEFSRDRERLALDSRAQFHIAKTARAIEDVYGAVA